MEVSSLNQSQAKREISRVPQLLRAVLGAVLGIAFSTAFWLLAYPASTLSPWQLTAIPGALFGACVGFATRRFSAGVIALLIFCSVYITLRGDHRKFVCDLQKQLSMKPELSELNLQRAMMEASAKMAAAEKAQKNEDRPAKEPQKQPHSPEPLGWRDHLMNWLWFDACDIYWPNLQSRLGLFAIAWIIALATSVQAARMSSRCCQSNSVSESASH